MSKQPTGTVTFLFTDIEGSTALLQELGNRYGEALEAHRRLLRDAFERHGGYEVDTQGDAFFVAFSRAQDAARAAWEAQRALATSAWPQDQPLQVRMGIHTCEAEASGTGYVGIGVHRGARICAAGHGGQVLVSHTTRDLLDEDDSGFGLRDLGEHRLKDLSEPHRVFQLLVDGVPVEFPPLRTLGSRPTNLPIQATPFIGREHEVRELGELVARPDVRLVTLTGPGGTGKTRLALQAAAELLETFPDGVFFVPLAPIVDPALVVPAAAEALGINEAGGQSLLGYLGDKRILFVLDNLEQVLEAAPQLADLLRDAPGVTLLATSREPLRVAAEHVVAVGALEERESLDLFVTRGTAVQPGFELTAANADALAEICLRLDGLPLALELAAARLPLLSPDALLARLDERLTLLTSGARDLPARQQTLRDTIAWSYDLLSEREQLLFTRLGVFAGGFTLESAEAVCDAALNDVASLVDKSLVRREGERFTMLETIREYALDRLAAANDGVRAAHARYFVELAEEAYPDRIEREAEWADRFAAEHDNVRAALEWLGEQAPADELRLAGAVGWFWRARSHMTEGRERLVAALAGAHTRDVVLARALTSTGALAAWQGDIDAATALLEDGIALWDELGDELEEALALESLAWGCFFAGDDANARAAAERSLALQRRGGDMRLVNRAQLTVCQVLVSGGDLEEAEALSHEALALADEHDDAWARHLAYHFLADCALIGENYELAEDRYTRSLEAAVALGDRTETAAELQGVAMALAGRSQPVKALRLGAAADAALGTLGVDISGIVFWAALQAKNLGRAREEIGPDRAAQAWDEGSRLTLAQAVDEVLAAV